MICKSFVDLTGGKLCSARITSVGRITLCRYSNVWPLHGPSIQARELT